MLGEVYATFNILILKGFNNIFSINLFILKYFYYSNVFDYHVKLFSLI